MPGPLVTIGIATYNRAHIVTRAIDSVLSQDYAPLRLVIVDDGSTDETADVLERHASDPRVTVVVRASNGGVATAKNTLLDHMLGIYGGIVDSDDSLFPGAISQCVKAFEELGEGVSQILTCCVDEAGAPTGHGLTASGFVSYEAALSDRFGGEFWQMFRIQDLGRRRFHPDAVTSETLVWHAMLREKPMYFLNVVTRRYNLRGADRISIDRRRDKKLVYGRMMAYKVYLDEFGEDLKRIAPARYAEVSLELAKWEARLGDRRKALRTLARARRSQPPKFGLALAVVLMPRALREAAYWWRDRRR